MNRVKEIFRKRIVDCKKVNVFLKKRNIWVGHDHPFRHRRGTSVPLLLASCLLLLLLARTYVHLAIDEVSDSYFKVHNSPVLPSRRFTTLVNSSVFFDFPIMNFHRIFN